MPKMICRCDTGGRFDPSERLQALLQTLRHSSLEKPSAVDVRNRQDQLSPTAETRLNERS